jgi:CHRD domain
MAKPFPTRFCNKNARLQHSSGGEFQCGFFRTSLTAASFFFSLTDKELIVMKTRIIAISIALLFYSSVAMGDTKIYNIVLDGPSESPPNASPGTGVGTVTLDLDLVTMRLETNFSGLLGTVTNAHIHCCTAVAGTSTAGVATPVPTFPGFPSGVTSGTYDRTFDMTSAASYNPAFVTANGGTVASALAALNLGMDTGKAYLNIHSSSFGGGEIRGFLQLVPEPTGGMLVTMLGGLLCLRRKR